MENTLLRLKRVGEKSNANEEELIRIASELAGRIISYLPREWTRGKGVTLSIGGGYYLLSAPTGKPYLHKKEKEGKGDEISVFTNGKLTRLPAAKIFARDLKAGLIDAVIKTVEQHNQQHEGMIGDIKKARKLLPRK